MYQFAIFKWKMETAEEMSEKETKVDKKTLIT